MPEARRSIEPAAGGHYLDAAAFTRLFRHRRRNHASICLGLRVLVAAVARRFWFPHADDRQEHESQALLHTIERIDRFKFKCGGDAFSYYSSLVYNRLLTQLRETARTQARARVFTDVFHSRNQTHSLADRRHGHHATHYARAV